MKPNILICGKTGVGKTSLVQAVTQVGTVPDDRIGHGSMTTQGFVVYETEVANFIDCEGMVPGSQTIGEYAKFILSEVNKRVDAGEVSQGVSAIWYCIDGARGRVEPADAQLIKAFDAQAAKVIVTKSETLRNNQRKEFEAALLDIIDKDRIFYVSSSQKGGLERLMEVTKQEAAKAFEEATAKSLKMLWDKYYRDLVEEWRRRVEDEADSIVNWGAGRAAAIAIIPLPMADVVPLVVNEGYMIYKLGNLYGYSVGANAVSMLGGVAGGSLAGKVLASFLPGLKIAIAAGVTYGVGKAAQAYFRSGKTLAPEDLKREFETGKEKASATDWEKRQITDEEV